MPKNCNTYSVVQYFSPSKGDWDDYVAITHNASVTKHETAEAANASMKYLAGVHPHDQFRVQVRSGD